MKQVPVCKFPVGQNRFYVLVRAHWTASVITHLLLSQQFRAWLSIIQSPIEQREGTNSEGYPRVSEASEGSPRVGEASDGSPRVSEVSEGSPRVSEASEGSRRLVRPARVLRGLMRPVRVPEGS